MSGQRNDKRKLFVQHYLITSNATESAKLAGYSAKTAHVQGSRLLCNADVSAAILAAQDKRSERLGIDADSVLRRIGAVIALCEASGDEFNPAAALKGLELLGKHKAMWTDRQEHTGAVQVVFNGPMPTFELTDKQRLLRDAAASSARHILGVGGSRSGKTFGFCYAVAARAIGAPDSRHLIARLHNVDVRQAVMLDTWPKMMRLAYPGVGYDVNKQDQVARLANGSEIWFGGLDDKDRADKVLGKEYATIYINEASQVAFDTVVTLRSRMAQAVDRSDGRPLPLKAYYDLNPTGRSHWTYLEFIKGLSPVSRQPFDTYVRRHVFLNPADNPHLPDDYLAELDEMPERQRKRFRDGDYMSEVPGALWTPTNLEQHRVAEAPELARVVVAIDPSGTDGGGTGDDVGIVVAGRGVDGRGYVLADLTCQLSPEAWARRAVTAYHAHKADRIVAERNFGGAMVAAVIRAVEAGLPYKEVNASRGKVARAEPVSALYEQGRVSHVGPLLELEDELLAFTSNGYTGPHSPNRADALVWALTEVMLGHLKPPPVSGPVRIPRTVNGFNRR